MPAPAASQAAIARALQAALAAGLRVTGFAVSRDGTVRVDTAPPGAEPANTPLDQSAKDVQPSTPKKWATR